MPSTSLLPLACHQRHQRPYCISNTINILAASGLSSTSMLLLPSRQAMLLLACHQRPRLCCSWIVTTSQSMFIAAVSHYILLSCCLHPFELLLLFMNCHQHLCCSWLTINFPSCYPPLLLLPPFLQSCSPPLHLLSYCPINFPSGYLSVLLLPHFLHDCSLPPHSFELLLPLVNCCLYCHNLPASITAIFDTLQTFPCILL